MSAGGPKGVVVGGSNVGLAVVLELLRQGYYVELIDKAPPNETSLALYTRQWNWRPEDLLYFNGDLFDRLSTDPAVELVFISAGLGRVAAFEELHPAEIDNVLEVNALAAIKILRCFYDRLLGEAPFYCGVMGSIAGLVSSPLFSVYGASKAALCRCTESLNIELEMAGSSNRILTVAPFSLAGTSFNGADNDLALLRPLAKELVDRMRARKTFYIPQYDKTAADVLERYRRDPHAFGVSSYVYKQKGGRVSSGTKAVIGYLSGTFDLFHIGHLNLLRKAREHCDYLIVGVHASGEWKGRETFIPLEERMALLNACRYVDKVVPAELEDSDAWLKYNFHRLFVGDDYMGSARFARYEEYFKDKNVEIIYFPYTRGTSSSKLRAVLTAALKKSKG